MTAREALADILSYESEHLTGREHAIVVISALRTAGVYLVTAEQAKVIRHALDIGQSSYMGDPWFAGNDGVIDEGEDGDEAFAAAYRVLATLSETSAAPAMRETPRQRAVLEAWRAAHARLGGKT